MTEETPTTEERVADYLTTTEWAKGWGYSPAHVRRLAGAGRLVLYNEDDSTRPAAVKRGRDWMVHKDAKILPAREPKHGEEIRAKWRAYQRNYREKRRKQLSLNGARPRS